MLKKEAQYGDVKQVPGSQTMCQISLTYGRVHVSATVCCFMFNRVYCTTALYGADAVIKSLSDIRLF